MTGQFLHKVGDVTMQGFNRLTTGFNRFASMVSNECLVRSPDICWSLAATCQNNPQAHDPTLLAAPIQVIQVIQLVQSCLIHLQEKGIAFNKSIKFNKQQNVSKCLHSTLHPDSTWPSEGTAARALVQTLPPPAKRSRLHCLCCLCHPVDPVDPVDPDSLQLSGVHP